MATQDSTKEIPEHLTRTAAERLARRIEAFWQARGKTVTCRVEPQSVDQGNMLWVVRSDIASQLVD
jgi:hypothetical protein